jgi:hypothetical protein
MERKCDICGFLVRDINVPCLIIPPSRKFCTKKLKTFACWEHTRIGLDPSIQNNKHLRTEQYAGLGVSQKNLITGTNHTPAKNKPYACLLQDLRSRTQQG